MKEHVDVDSTGVGMGIGSGGEGRLKFREGFANGEFGSFVVEVGVPYFGDYVDGWRRRWVLVWRRGRGGTVAASGAPFGRDSVDGRGVAAGDGLAQYSLVSGGMGRVDQAYVEFGTEVGVDDAGDEIMGEVPYSHAHEGEGDGGVWELDREEVRGGGG